jgi:hypothetical protein
MVRENSGRIERNMTLNIVGTIKMISDSFSSMWPSRVPLKRYRLIFFCRRGLAGWPDRAAPLIYRICTY